MEEAASVLDRIARIRELDRANAPVGLVLGELRKLVGEAEAWAGLEGDERAHRAVAELETSLRQTSRASEATAAGVSHGGRGSR